MKRIWFVSNFVFGNQISGGVIHYLEMAKACKKAGYDVRFLGGSGMKRMLANYNLDLPVEVTDIHETGIREPVRLKDQLAVFRDNYRRCRNSFSKLDVIGPEDIAYAVTDYWCDTLPVILSRAQRKVMIWHMEAPSLEQIIMRSRPDVPSSRLSSIHYWVSQKLSLALFRHCRNKRVLHVHPAMREKLIARGYQSDELADISFGVDVNTAARMAHAVKTYDVVWIGRVHRQKGIEDLLESLVHLAQRVNNFRAVLIGNLKELTAEVERRGLSHCVEFADFVSEEEKFRLFHASRVFLMTSRFEGSPRVVAEALVCNVPVVAYELETYRPIYGDYLRYVPCFDRAKFKEAAAQQVMAMRRGENHLAQLDLDAFRKQHCWAETGNIFCKATA